MNSDILSNSSAPKPSTPFPWPRDSQAWWSVLACQLGGWAFVLGPRFTLDALLLAVAALGLFFSSDWLSHLAGRSREGEVHPARWDQPVGLALMALTLASLILFILRQEASEREAWATVITGVGCLVTLMFVLRFEWRPLDGRLLYLTHVILTLPALVLGFTVWGVGDPQAFGAWVLPAVYFPAQALFAQYWMEGSDAPGHSLSVLAAPLLLGILLQAFRGGWPAVAFLGLFLLRTLWLLQRRRAAAGGLPNFSAVRNLSLEMQAWSVCALVAWGLTLI